MTSGVYDCFKEDLMTGSIDLVNDTINIALYDESHQFISTETAYTTDYELPTAGNYIQGGTTLNNKTVTIGKWDADDVVWGNATFTAYHAVIYDVTNANSLVCSIDFGTARPATAEAFTIHWNDSSNAIITI